MADAHKGVIPSIIGKVLLVRYRLFVLSVANLIAELFMN